MGSIGDTILKRKNLLEPWQWEKIRISIGIVVIIPLTLKFIGMVVNCFDFLIAAEVWKDKVSNMALYIWSGQITASLIIFTLLALISNKMDERILGIRIGTWLFKYNLYFFNLWECIVLIGLINVLSIFMLITKRNFLIITNFMCVGALILFCCYFIFLVFYKRSRIYYRISLVIDPDECRYNKHCIEEEIIKKLKGKKLVDSNMKLKIESGNKSLVYESSYHREEIILLADIYFKIYKRRGDQTQSKEILIKAIIDILCSSGKQFSGIFKKDSKHCNLDEIIRIYSVQYEELKKKVTSDQGKGISFGKHLSYKFKSGNLRCASKL